MLSLRADSALAVCRCSRWESSEITNGLEAYMGSISLTTVSPERGQHKQFLGCASAGQYSTKTQSTTGVVEERDRLPEEHEAGRSGSQEPWQCAKMAP